MYKFINLTVRVLQWYCKCKNIQHEHCAMWKGIEIIKYNRVFQMLNTSSFYEIYSVLCKNMSFIWHLPMTCDESYLYSKVFQFKGLPQPSFHLPWSWLSHWAAEGDLQLLGHW